MKPTIVACFRGDDILREQGRLLFAALRPFAQAGYPIQLLDTVTRESAGKFGQGIFQFPELALTDQVPRDTENKILLHDGPGRANAAKGWMRTARIRFDIFSSYWPHVPIVMPYPVFPIVHTGPDFDERLESRRASKRHVRLFFSGDMKGYTKNRIRYPAPKLPRAEVIDTIREALPDKTLFVDDAGQIVELFAGQYLNRCVLIDTRKTWLDDRLWMDHLAKTDFFLAPPGIVMPMCHNIIEAMSVGAIPVTSYPEWLTPSLEHGKNCIVYSTKHDLVEKVRAVLNMGEDAIASLRRNVIAYYDTHLRQERFIEDFESRGDRDVDILMISERYVAQNAHKLNERSFIIRGAPPGGPTPWEALLHVLRFRN